MPFSGLLGGKAGSLLLRTLLRPREPENSARSHVKVNSRKGSERFTRAFGEAFSSAVCGRTVLDYGCGSGEGVLSLARLGARRVIGLDIREDVLNCGRELVRAEGVEDQCIFLNTMDPEVISSLYGAVEAIISLDAFEHYANPDEVLKLMKDLLSEDGSIYVEFGPPWWHPYGCHMMFLGAPPWTHVLFDEKIVMSVRALYRSDGALRYEDVEGGLNRMTVRRFERMVQTSGFTVKALECVPIRGMKMWSRNRLGRELFTSVVRAQLMNK